jgi:cysteine-rich repeat protein
LSKNFAFGGQILGNAVSFIPPTGGEHKNYFNPGDDNKQGVFNSTKKLYSLEIIPIRYQVLDNKKQLVSCGDARIVEKINCDYIPQGVCGDGNIDAGEQCDDGNTANGDGCDSTCQTETCTDTCLDLGYTCGDVCGVSCGVCNSGFKCEVNTCVVDLCGNGIFEPSAGEQCDDGNTNSGDGCSSSCQIEN